MTEKTPKKFYIPKTNEEIKKIANDAFNHNIFFDFFISKEPHNKHLIAMVFQPLLFMTQKQMELHRKHKIVCVYEYLSEAENELVYGYPTFLSMCTLNEIDFRKMIDELEWLLTR